MKPLLIWREVPNPHVPRPRRKFIAWLGQLGFVRVEQNFADPSEWDVWIHIAAHNYQCRRTQPSLERAQLRAENKARDMLRRVRKWVELSEQVLSGAAPTVSTVFHEGQPPHGSTSPASEVRSGHEASARRGASSDASVRAAHPHASSTGERPSGAQAQSPSGQPRSREVSR